MLPSETLKNKFISYFFHSHLLYEISVWSDTFNMYLKPKQSSQNKTPRIFGIRNWNDNSTSFLLAYWILKLDDLAHQTKNTGICLNLTNVHYHFILITAD